MFPSSARSVTILSVFDGNLEHRGVAATNVDRRLVLNINYFEK